MYSGSTGAPPGFSVKNKATTTPSSARQTDSSFAIKGRITPEDQSFTSTSKFPRNIDVAEGPSSSTRSDKSPTRDRKSKHSSVGGSSSLANGAESESLSSGLDHISLDSKPGSSKLVIPKKTLAQYKPEKWILPDKEDGTMTQLNLAIVSYLRQFISSSIVILFRKRLYNVIGGASGWPCRFRKVNFIRKTLTPFGTNIKEADA